MPFGASKAAILGASGGGASYDPAYTWIADIMTTNSTTSTVSFTSIPQTYHALHLVGNCNITASAYALFRLRSTSAEYFGCGVELGSYSSSAGPYIAAWNSASSTNYAYFGGYSTDTSVANEIGGQYIEMWLPGYSNTDKPKTMWTKWYDPSDSAWYGNMATEELVRIEANAAIDQIDMFNSGSGSIYWYTDSMWTLYGVGTAS